LKSLLFQVPAVGVALALSIAVGCKKAPKLVFRELISHGLD
jgi:hypothetical protein